MFILCLEILSTLIAKEEVKGWINGIQICHKDLAMSYLMYADDIMIAYKANNYNAIAVKKMMDYIMDSLSKNLIKSNLIFSSLLILLIVWSEKLRIFLIGRKCELE